MKVEGVDCIIVIGLGKGGVGKFIVLLNFVVVLVKQGCKVGLLDVDIYGLSQLCMMGVSGCLGLLDGQMIILLQFYGVIMMFIGLMVDLDKVVVWWGFMLMGVL